MRPISRVEIRPNSSRNLASPGRRGSSWVKVLTATSGFLISWAMPAASVWKYTSRSARRRSSSSSLNGVRSLKTATAPRTLPLGSRTGETVQMTGRLVGPSASATATSSTSGCVRTCPSETVACSGSARQAGNSSAVPPRAVSAGNPVSRSAARLNIATRPVALMATTPLSIVAAMFSRYSLATVTAVYSCAFLIATPA